MSGGNKNIAERIIDFINSFSYKEKENRRLVSYKEKIVRYNCMSKEELSMKYNDVKTDYEYEKMVLLAIMTTVIISVIMNVWRLCFEFFRKAFILLAESNGSEDVSIKTSFILTLMFLAMITLVVFGIIYNKFKRVKCLLWEVNFLEEYKKGKVDNESCCE